MEKRNQDGQKMNKQKITFGSLFAGIGGFDLGLEMAGMKCKWQIEKNNQCQDVLRKHWPDVKLYNDITKENKYAQVELICGGDPCPIRSRARSNGQSRHPDLSGYFLSLVGQLRPRWVVRENVLASDDVDFECALEILGYRTAIIRSDAASITGQSRQRDFVVGCREVTWPCFSEFISNFEDGKGSYKTRLGTREVVPALTTHRTRYDSRDCYIFDGGLRILDGDERTAFAGFPKNWLDGFTEASIARMTGNAVVPQIVEIIGKVIVKLEKVSRRENGGNPLDEE